MNRFIYNGNSDIITDAINDANFIFQNEEFFTRLSGKESFDASNATGEKIKELIKISPIIATIELYKPAPLPPWSRANAYTTESQPASIFLNKRKLNRSIESIAATLVHEYIHLIDFSTAEYSFGHGDNSSGGKDDTAPYWIDMLAYELLTGKTSKSVYQHADLLNLSK